MTRSLFPEFWLQDAIEFEEYSTDKYLPSLVVVLDSELVGDVEHSNIDVVKAQQLYKSLQSKKCYPIDLQKGTHVLVLPNAFPKSLSSHERGGNTHRALQWAHQVWSALTKLDSCVEKKNIFLNCSEALISALGQHRAYFLLGMCQRAIKNKLKTSEKDWTVSLDSQQFSKDDKNKASHLHFAMTLTRSLINCPPNLLLPSLYQEYVERLVQHEKIKLQNAELNLEVLNHHQLKSMGCGLISAVGQGSADAPRILHLTYKTALPKGKVAFVGKGITFDSGGLDIKPSAGMRHMKKDMGGSAAVLGIFIAAMRLNLNVDIDCYLAIAENMISGTSMRPGDVYTAKNGLSVEIDNTDAEGRLVLADALCCAQDASPDWLVDLATLTGAARVALGPRVDSLMTNSEGHKKLLMAAASETGDWVWPLPLVYDYESMLESNVADVSNSAASGHGGAITAGLFLNKFIKPGVLWTHVDTYMWADKPNELVSEAGATAKCLLLFIEALQQYDDLKRAQVV